MERLMKMLAKRKRGKGGFTLIELMIVVIIVGILAAAAVPIYTGFVKRAYVTEAKASIGTIRSAEEVYFAEHGKYVGFTDIIHTSSLLKTTLGVDLSKNSWWKGTGVEFSITPTGDEPTTLETIVATADSSPSKIMDIGVTLTVADGTWVVSSP